MKCPTKVRQVGSHTELSRCSPILYSVVCHITVCDFAVCVPSRSHPKISRTMYTNVLDHARYLKCNLILGEGKMLAATFPSSPICSVLYLGAFPGKKIARTEQSSGSISCITKNLSECRQTPLKSVSTHTTENTEA